MADHRDYADDARQPSLFDVLAQPPARPAGQGAETAEGGRVVEFPRRRDADADAPATGAAEAVAATSPEPTAEAPTGFLDPAPVQPVAPEDAWLTELAPDVEDAGLAAPAPSVVVTDPAPEEAVVGEPRTQRAAGAPLAGPTLDDVVSRVWEGLAMGLPAACPVCLGEVLPALEGARHGRCTSCATTIE